MFKQSSYKSGQKSPRNMNMCEGETEHDRLAFKKSYKPITKPNNISVADSIANLNNHNNNNLDTNNDFQKGGQRRNEEKSEK